MYIPDEEKEGRQSALKKLMSLMSEESGGSFKGGSKGGLEPEVGLELEVEADPEVGLEMSLEEEGEEPSDEEKSQIAEMYHKYCK